MKLPSFEDFEKTITDEQRESWFNTVNFKVYDTPPPTAKHLADIAVRVGYLSALGLMSAYHSWLSEQLAISDEPR